MGGNVYSAHICVCFRGYKITWNLNYKNRIYIYIYITNIYIYIHIYICTCICMFICTFIFNICNMIKANIGAGRWLSLNSIQKVRFIEIYLMRLRFYLSSNNIMSKLIRICDPNQMVQLLNTGSWQIVIYLKISALASKCPQIDLESVPSGHDLKPPQWPGPPPPSVLILIFILNLIIGQAVLFNFLISFVFDFLFLSLSERQRALGFRAVFWALGSGLWVLGYVLGFAILVKERGGLGSATPPAPYTKRY